MKLYNNFSIWIAALVGLWLLGFVPFSPLFLILLNLVWVTFFIVREYDLRLTWVGLLLLLIHAKPAYFFRHHDLDIPESVAFFVAYNLFLLLQGTNVYREYSAKYNDEPRTFREFVKQA